MSLDSPSLKGKEDKTEESKDTINVTADMFGDIESYSHNRHSRSSEECSVKPQPKEPPTGRRSCLSRCLREDEYAHSLANGFTIIIDSVDDDNIDSLDVGFLKTDDEDMEDEEMIAEELAKLETINEVKIAKSVTFKDNNTETQENKSEQLEQQDDKDGTDVDIGNVQKTKRPKAVASVSKTNGRKAPVKPSMAGKARPTKNKLGLRLKIDTDKVAPLSPYYKSTQSVKGKVQSQTNKAREQQNETSRNRLPNGNVNESKRVYTDISSSAKDKNVADRINIFKVAGASAENIVNNSDVDDNKITCEADIHRENTLSPNGDMEDGVNPCVDSSARSRKISVISIGSVLKDGRETLV